MNRETHVRTTAVLGQPVMVIVFCPCCNSTLDVQTRLTPQTLECPSCGQMWSMVIEAERFAAYSLT
jgi:hypothetical protein